MRGKEALIMTVNSMCWEVNRFRREKHSSAADRKGRCSDHGTIGQFSTATTDTLSNSGPQLGSVVSKV